MSEVKNDQILYVLERMVYDQFLKKGVKGLNNTELVVIHAVLARCECILDKECKFIRIVEHELLLRLRKESTRICKNRTMDF